MAQSGTGLEKVILSASKGIGALENRIDIVFYGQGKKKGIYDVLKAINEIDFCNIVNFFLTKVTFNFKKNPDLLKKFEALQARAADLSDILSKYTNFTTVDNSPRTPESLSAQAIPNKDQAANKAKIFNILQEFKKIPEIPTVVLSAVPGLGRIRSTVADIIGVFGKYQSLDSIPQTDIKKIANKIYDLQAILNTVSSINTLQSVVNLAKLQSSIQKLQKFINPGRIIPEVKRILQIVRNIHQTGLQILKIISFARLVVKILVVVIKVFKIILRLFPTLPLPNMFTTHGITATLEDIKETLRVKTSALLDRAKQINELLGVVYDFTLSFLEKTDLIIKELEILLLNLENCNQTKDSPLIDDIKINLKIIKKTQEKLKQFTDDYSRVKNSLKNELKIGRYTIRIVEEEIVDEGRNLKRRKAFAFDERGKIVEEGDLTFATDTAVLIEELRLKLISKNLISPAVSNLTTDEQLLLEDVSSILNVENEDLEIETEPSGDVADIQNEIDSFIKNLKGGRQLKKKVQAKVSDRIKTLKKDIKTEAPTSTAGNLTSNLTTTITGRVNTPTLLTESQREALKKIVRDGKQLWDSKKVKAAAIAKQQLEEDDNARQSIAGY